MVISESNQMNKIQFLNGFQSLFNRNCLIVETKLSIHRTNQWYSLNKWKWWTFNDEFVDSGRSLNTKLKVSFTEDRILWIKWSCSGVFLALQASPILIKFRLSFKFMWQFSMLRTVFVKNIQTISFMGQIHLMWLYIVFGRLLNLPIGL